MYFLIQPSCVYLSDRTRTTGRLGLARIRVAIRDNLWTTLTPVGFWYRIHHTRNVLSLSQPNDH